MCFGSFWMFLARFCKCFLMALSLPATISCLEPAFDVHKFWNFWEDTMRQNEWTVKTHAHTPYHTLLSHYIVTHTYTHTLSINVNLIHLYDRTRSYTFCSIAYPYQYIHKRSAYMRILYDLHAPNSLPTRTYLSNLFAYMFFYLLSSCICVQCICDRCISTYW